MTVVCAVNDGRRTLIGADSLAYTRGIGLGRCMKWVCGHGWAVGDTGFQRGFNILEAHAETLLADLGGPYDFTVRVRDRLERDGWNFDTTEGPRSFGQQFVLANQRNVWHICGGLSITRIPQGMVWAEGSGQLPALGAGNLKDDQRPMTDRIAAAVWAGIQFDQHCGGSVWLAVIDGSAKGGLIPLTDHRLETDATVAAPLIEPTIKRAMTNGTSSVAAPIS